MDAGNNGDSIISIGQEAKVLYGTPEWMPEVDLMRGIIINIRKRGMAGKSQNELIAMLEELLSAKESGEKKRRLEEEHGIRMSVEMERRGHDMCNLSELVWEEGMEQGMEQGLEQGRVRAVMGDVQKLIKKLGMTAEQAMDILEVSEKRP